MNKNYTKFRLHVGRGKKEYYQVFIFNNKELMGSFSKQIIHKPVVDNVEASTYSFNAHKRVKGRDVRSNMIGAILLYKGGFGHGVVAHEIAHAMNYYYLKHGLDFKMHKHDDKWVEYDETYATMLGYMVNQFWKKYNGKIYKERY